MSQVNFGHHLVLTLKKESEVWPRPWGWLWDPDVMPLPSRESYQEAVQALGKTELGRKCAKRFSSFVEVIQEGTREGYMEFQAALKKLECAGAKKGDAGRGLKQLESCLRLRFDKYLVPLLEAIGLTFCPTQPNLFVGPESGGDYRIIVFADKKVDRLSQHPWAVCLVTKVVVLDSLEKLAGLAVAKALGGKGEEGLERLECSAIQKEIVGAFFDKKEKMKDWEIQMHRELAEPHCRSEDEEEEEDEGSAGMESGGEFSIDKSEGWELEGEERKMAASKESIVLSRSEEEEEEGLDGIKTDGKESTDRGSTDEGSTGKRSQSRKTENEEKKMATSIGKELISVM